LVWFGLVWFGLVWFGLVWFGLDWFGLVCEWSMEVHAACTCDIFRTQASKSPHDAGLDKHRTL
jgi:hypothetical protein